MVLSSLGEHATSCGQAARRRQASSGISLGNHAALRLSWVGGACPVRIHRSAPRHLLRSAGMCFSHRPRRWQTAAERMLKTLERFASTGFDRDVSGHRAHGPRYPSDALQHPHYEGRLALPVRQPTTIPTERRPSATCDRACGSETTKSGLFVQSRAVGPVAQPG